MQTHPERIIPDETEPGIVAYHLKRYELAVAECEGREVLDVGCGVGYGSALLADRARRVVGVDVSEAAIEHARARYAGPNVEFRAMDALALDFAAESFDVVCSFETLEHVSDPDRLVAEVARVLRVDGTFFVSSPRVDETTHAPANPFHTVEYSRRDFEALLTKRFVDVEIWGQRRAQTARHRLMQRLDVLGLRRRFTFLRGAALLLGTPVTAEMTAADVVLSRDDLDRAAELVGVCRGPR